LRVLVTGWFSFEGMGASAGDLMARDVVCDWLGRAGIPYDIALAHPFEGGVAWQEVDPNAYSHVSFICGPFGEGPPLLGFLERFSGRPMVGIDLTMLQPLQEWNPFEVLYERDSSRTARPDLAFLAPDKRVPIVARILIDNQPEYGARDWHAEAHRMIAQVLDTRDAVVIPVDTRLDENRTGLRSVSQVESAIARVDASMTTRLHGMVLSLKNGVPPVVIDPVKGGGKITRQAEAIGWPTLFTHRSTTVEGLSEALDYCLTEEARLAARECRERARRTLAPMQESLVADLKRTAEE
jgi:hypothetical protein